MPKRRDFLISAVTLLMPSMTFATPLQNISWEDLIPVGVPYAEIIEEGDVDFDGDTWQPVFDENARKLNTDLNGITIRMPGYVIPLGMSASGVTSFILVPYIGACIHVPPPPPNQLVYVEAGEPWSNDNLWSAVWVSGKLSTTTTSTELAEIGYSLDADKIELHTEGPRKQRFSRTPFHPYNWF